MKMIRRAVLTWGHFQSLDDARLMNALPRTWKEVYNHGGRLLNTVLSREGFDTPTVHVQSWTRAWLLQFYASQPGVRDPQTLEVWEQWANAQLPPRVKDFAQKVLWHKLTVHERVYKRSGTDTCPICAKKESIKHAMVERSMFKAAAAVIQHYFGPVATGDGEFSVRDMMESGNQDWLLNTDQGRAMWSARSAHWRYRCEVKAGASPVFASYLTTWLRELCGWIEYRPGEGPMGRFQAIAGATSRHRGAATTRGSTHKQGLSVCWQTHAECFTQDRNMGTRNWLGEAEPPPKRPREAGPGVLQGVQDLIAELEAKGYIIVYTDGGPQRD